MPFWTRTARFFIETQTLRGVETQASSVYWICLRIQTSCLVLETWELHSGTSITRVSHFGAGRMRVSHFEIGRMRVSCLDTETRGWGTQDSRSKTEMRSSHCLRKCEYEHRVLNLQNRLHLQNFRSVVNKHDAFVDVQHSDGVARVVGNPRQPEITEFREEKDGRMNLHHHFDHMPSH